MNRDPTRKAFDLSTSSATDGALATDADVRLSRRRLIQRGVVIGALGAGASGVALVPSASAARACHDRKHHFRDMVFSPGQGIVLDLGAGPLAARVSGTATVSAHGEATGVLSVDWPGHDVRSSLEFRGDEVVATTRGSSVSISPRDAGDEVVVNGRPVKAPVVLEQAYAEWRADANPASWSPIAQSTAALTAFMMTPLAQNNVQAALAFNRPGFWCKASCFGIGAIVAAVIAIGCAVLLTGCATATAITIGGVAVPCGFLIAICVGGVFGGWGVTYAAWVEHVWGG